MKKKKSSLTYVWGILIIVAIGVFFLVGTRDTEQKKSEITNKAMQNVVLSMKNGNYYPQTITVTAGKPVSLSLDASVQGCFRQIMINAFGVQAYLKTPQEAVTFTPTTPGTYVYTCGLGMGKGTIIVE